MTTSKTHNLLVPPIDDLFDLINNNLSPFDEKRQNTVGLGTYNEVSTLLKTIENRDSLSKIIPLAEWKQQLLLLNRPAWYYIHRSPVFPFVYSCVIILIVATCIYSRVFVKNTYLRITKMFVKGPQISPGPTTLDNLDIIISNPSPNPGPSSLPINDKTDAAVVKSTSRKISVKPQTLMTTSEK